MEVYNRWQSEDNLFLAGTLLIVVIGFGLPSVATAALLLALGGSWSWVRHRREQAWAAHRIASWQAEREAEDRREVGADEMPDFNDAYEKIFGRRLGE
jgi:hypothetical protein